MCLDGLESFTGKNLSTLHIRQEVVFRLQCHKKFGGSFCRFIMWLSGAPKMDACKLESATVYLLYSLDHLMFCLC